MKFMIIRKADAATEAGVLPSEELLTQMLQYNEEMIKAGIMRDGMGLQPSAKGARISFAGGKPTVTDGPFAEAKELIAGFTLIEVASRAEALAWVRRWPALDGGGNVQLELRQVYEAADFGELMTPELRQQEERLRGDMAARADPGRPS
ncbi:MAG TPA: YciI family protein [Variovorax sp.]|jgi:hypothetical protein